MCVRIDIHDSDEENPEPTIEEIEDSAKVDDYNGITKLLKVVSQTLGYLERKAQEGIKKGLLVTLVGVTTQIAMQISPSSSSAVVGNTNGMIALCTMAFMLLLMGVILREKAGAVACKIGNIAALLGILSNKLEEGGLMHNLEACRTLITFATRSVLFFEYFISCKSSYSRILQLQKMGKKLSSTVRIVASLGQKLKNIVLEMKKIHLVSMIFVYWRLLPDKTQVVVLN